MIFEGLLMFYLLQRLSELVLGKRNLTVVEGQLYSAVDQREKRNMLMLHSLWFVSTALEYTWHGAISETLFKPALGVLVLCQGIRFSSMLLLKKSWIPYPVAYSGQKIVKSGPYGLIRHPNYLVVLIEVALVPMLGGCYYTALFFGAANLVFLLKRIKIEEHELANIPTYRTYSMNTKKLIPYLFSLLITFGLKAETMTISHKNFSDAENAETYFRFIGESKKLGLFKTNFSGYAKEAILDFERDTTTLKNVRLWIDTQSIDTDQSSRNEKMQELCLETKKFPELVVRIPMISTQLEEQKITGSMQVRDREVPVEIRLTKDGSVYTGKSSFNLSAAGIPDPSIAVASVKDTFEIEFKVKLAP